MPLFTILRRPFMEKTLVSTDTEIADGSMQDVGSQVKTHHANYAALYLKVTEAGAGISVVTFQALLSRLVGGDEFVEPKYAGDAQTVTDRIHSVAIGGSQNFANVGGTLVVLFNLFGANYVKIQANFTTGGANPVINSAYLKLIA